MPEPSPVGYERPSGYLIGITHLSTPAKTECSPLTNRRESGLILRNSLGENISVARNVRLVLDEIPYGLFLLLGVRWNAIMGQLVALEEIRNQHDSIQSHSQKVSTLKSLTGQSKDIVNVHESNVGIHVASHVWTSERANRWGKVTHKCSGQQ